MQYKQELAPSVNRERAEYIRKVASARYSHYLKRDRATVLRFERSLRLRHGA